MNKYKHFSKVEEKLRYHDCESKKRFPTFESAKNYNKGQTVYFCKHCGDFHLTSKLGRLLAKLKRLDKSIG